MKHILYSVILITLLSCNKKEETKLVQKTEKEFIDDPLIYEVINAVLEMPEFKQDSAEYMLNTANLFLFDLGIDGDNFFSYANKYCKNIDTLSIRNQIRKSRYSFYLPDKIKNYQLIDYDLTSVTTEKELDSLSNISSKFPSNISISIPIFITKDAVFISYVNNTHYAKSFFVSKNNGNWTISDYYEFTEF